MQDLIVASAKIMLVPMPMPVPEKLVGLGLVHEIQRSNIIIKFFILQNSSTPIYRHMKH